MKSFKQIRLIEAKQTKNRYGYNTAGAIIDAAIKAGLKVKWQEAIKPGIDGQGIDIQVTGDDKSFKEFYKLQDDIYNKDKGGKIAWDPKQFDQKKYKKYIGKV